MGLLIDTAPVSIYHPFFASFQFPRQFDNQLNYDKIILLDSKFICLALLDIFISNELIIMVNLNFFIFYYYVYIDYILVLNIYYDCVCVYGILYFFLLKKI